MRRRSNTCGRWNHGLDKQWLDLLYQSERKPTICNDGLCGLGIHNTGQMCVQHATILVISSMDLEKVGTEVLDNNFVLVLTLAKGENTAKESSVNDPETGMCIYALLVDFLSFGKL